jgi:predicted phage gp36 major capsid-like protein
LINRSLVNEIRKFKATDGHYLWQPALSAETPPTLLGYPLFISDDMPVKAASSDSVAFGNFKSGYTIVDRADISILRDPFTAKPYVKFYATKRVGGEGVTQDADIRGLIFKKCALFSSMLKKGAWFYHIYLNEKLLHFKLDTANFSHHIFHKYMLDCIA